METTADLFIQAFIPAMVAALLGGVAWWFISACLSAKDQREWVRHLGTLPIREQINVVLAGTPHDRMFLIGLWVSAFVILPFLALFYFLLIP